MNTEMKDKLTKQDIRKIRMLAQPNKKITKTIIAIGESAHPFINKEVVSNG